MRKFGKYEKMRKNAILQTYITSLLCLVLCVTMFFGTSMAWFSDTAESTYNEMYVGTLEIDLNHASFKGGALQLTDNKMNAVEGEYKIFTSGKKNENGIRWEPGYTAVEKFEVIEGEDSDLAFSYQMGIECEFVDTKDTEDKVTTSAAAKEAIAKAITVWNYLGDDAASITELPKDFDTLTKAGWEKVGTLYDVISNHLPVFEGEMNKDAVTAKDANNAPVRAKAYHLIALHMDEKFDGAITKDSEGKIITSVQGQTLNDITIKLVATQKASEQDAFNNAFDAAADGFVVVSTEEELTKAVAEGATKLYLLDGEYKITGCGGKNLTLSGSKNAVIKLKIEGENTMDYGFDGSTVSFNGVTIDTNGQRIGFARMTATFNDCVINGTLDLASGDKTFKNCTFNVSGDNYNVWTWSAKNVQFVDCTFNSDGKAILLYGGENTNLTVNNCVFNDKGGLTAKKAAIEIGDDYSKSYTLVVNKTTVNGYEINDEGINTGTTLWGNKNSMGTDKLNVIVDGVDVY